VNKPAEYRANAETCRRMAVKAQNDGGKPAWLDMAQSWSFLTKLEDVVPPKTFNAAVQRYRPTRHFCWKKIFWGVAVNRLKTYSIPHTLRSTHRSQIFRNKDKATRAARICFGGASNKSHALLRLPGLRIIVAGRLVDRASQILLHLSNRFRNGISVVALRRLQISSLDQLRNHFARSAVRRTNDVTHAYATQHSSTLSRGE
jgi:hypothetical protein